MWQRLVAAVLAAALLVAAGVWAFVGRDGDASARKDEPAGQVDGSQMTPRPESEPMPRSAVEGEYAEAASAPVEDSYYPESGDPGIDSLHHDLTLDWDPDAKHLTASDELTFVATTDARRIRLDLGEPLTVASASLDGVPAKTRERGKDLIVRAPVVEGRAYVLLIEYAGTPAPVPAPTDRSDIASVGLTVEPDGMVWTMQEPFGAYTWYPVNDQPADKAFYDFTITAPSPMVGVANGELTSRKESGGTTTTTWHADAPMSSYLTTLAIAPYDTIELETTSGTPISLWALAGRPEVMAKLKAAKPAIEWIEERLGPYPFSTAGIVHVAGESGMETQTMVTLGDNDYALSEPVIVHELIHHWYGDQVSPTDWRDVWMSEGMTMYLQAIYEARDDEDRLEATIDGWAASDETLRGLAGPPGDYDPKRFGDSNVYYSPAVMWHELRDQLGDDAFWEMARAWPEAHPRGNATREEYLAWIEDFTDQELSDFFDAWLLGDTTPPRD